MLQINRHLTQLHSTTKLERTESLKSLYDTEKRSRETRELGMY